MNKIKTFVSASWFVLACVAYPAFAQATPDQSKLAGSAAAEMSDAEVRKVDKEQGKLTLKHGPIKNLDMPGMTMVFTVKDKAMLDGVKAGDKVKFTAASENGKMTVLQIKPAN